MDFEAKQWVDDGGGIFEKKYFFNRRIKAMHVVKRYKIEISLFVR